MNFYGRDEQLKVLSALIEKGDMQTVLIYGRRRVGKTALIKQLIDSTQVKSIYYECKETTEENNIESISSVISYAYNLPPLNFTSFEKTLEYLFEKSVSESLLLVIDEYPYLKKIVPGMDSILQSLIDRYRDRGTIKLIICGSYVGIMKNLVTSDSPLYGRIDKTVDLKPMDYYESSLFYKGFSNEDKIRLYSVFGGIPYYNRLIDPKASVRENIINLIASNGARLENEVSMYLKSEISKINNANEVFETLAKGYSRFSDILDKSHVSSSPTMVDVLDKLISMSIVKKTTPINDEQNKKKAGYYISDPLSMFYYRYCFRYSSQLSVMNPDAFYDRYIAKDFEEWYVPHFFEEICKQYLVKQNKQGKAPIPFHKIGKYWYNSPSTHSNGEFDIVTEGDDGFVFYEAKFMSKPLSRRTIEEEIEQVNKTGLKCNIYGFISRTGFEVDSIANCILINLEELYK